MVINKNTENILSIVFIVCIMTTALIGNMLIVIATIKCRQLRTFTNLLICNLAVSDLLITCLNLPLRFCQYFGVDLTTSTISNCKLIISLTLVLFTSSNANLFLITLDRFFGVVYPLRYRSSITRCKVGTAVFVGWSYAVCVGLMTFLVIGKTRLQSTERLPVCTFTTVMSTGYLLFLEFVIFMFPGLVMFVMYAVILKHIYSSDRNKIRSCTQLSPGTSPNNWNRVSSVKDGQTGSKRAKTMRMIARDVKLAKGVCLIVFVYIILLMPVAIIDVIETISKEPIVPMTVIKITIFLAYSNPAVNPPIYAISVKKYRIAFLEILRFKKKKQFCDSNHMQQQHVHKQIELKTIKDVETPTPKFSYSYEEKQFKF